RRAPVRQRRPDDQARVVAEVGTVGGRPQVLILAEGAAARLHADVYGGHELARVLARPGHAVGGRVAAELEQELGLDGRESAAKHRKPGALTGSSHAHAAREDRAGEAVLPEHGSRVLADETDLP